MTATVRGISPEGRDGSRDNEGNREYTVVYLVQTDDKNDGPAQVEQAFGIPAIGDIYASGNDFDAAAVVVDKSVSQRDSPWEWEVQVTYSTDTTRDPNEPENPLDRPPDISWGGQSRRVIANGRYTDASVPSPDGDLDLGILGPNGMLFDPQPEMDLNEPILTVVRNVASINPGELMSWANCVNRTPFYGASQRTLKMNAPQAVSRFSKEFGTYWQVTFSMVYRFEKWDLQILNQGTQYLTSGSTKLTPFTDSNGIGRIGLLTSTGGALNSSKAESLKGVYDPDANAPTYTRFRVYREIDFNALGIL